MEEIKTYSIPIRNVQFESTDNDQFLRAKFFAIAEGDNLNSSSFEIAGMQKCVESLDYANKPILGAWDKDKISNLGIGDFGGHDSDIGIDKMSGDVYSTYLGEKNERPLGLILPNTAKIEMFKDKQWISFEGLIWSKYNREAVTLLRKRRSNNVSVEIEVLSSFVDERGIEVIQDFTLLGITVIGVEPGIENANLVLDFTLTPQYNEFVRVFSRKINELEGKSSKMEELEFLKKDKFGTGEALSLDLSKESASEDAWGEINKSKLRNDLLVASNYKSLVKKAYLVVLEGWEDAPSENLKYPIVQIKEGKVVYNINGVEAAGAYLMKEKDASYFRSAKAKLNNIRQKLGKDKLMAIFGIETNDDFGEEVSQKQPPIIKMTQTEVMNELFKLLEEKKVLEQAKAEKDEIFENALGEFEMADEDEMAEKQETLNCAKEELEKAECAICEKDKELLSTAEKLLGADKESKLMSDTTDGGTAEKFEETQEGDSDEDECDCGGECKGEDCTCACHSKQCESAENGKVEKSTDAKKDDDEECEEPINDEEYSKICNVLGDGKKFVSKSNSHIVYEQDGELFAIAFTNNDGAIELTGDASKCEKVFARFITGGVAHPDETLPLPLVSVEISSGISQTYTDLKEKDQIIVDVKDEVKEYKETVAVQMSKFEELTDGEQLSGEFRHDVRGKILSSEFANSDNLEMFVKSKLYDMRCGQPLSGTFGATATNKLDKEQTINDKAQNLLKSKYSK